MPRKAWFEVHMRLNPTADPNSEWARLTSPTRDDYDRDDIASAILIGTLERLHEKRLAIPDDLSIPEFLKRKEG